jgi:hypothetical protein
MSDISGVFIPLPMYLQISKSVLKSITPKTPQIEYGLSVISDTEKQLNTIYYIKSAGGTSMK